MQQDEPFSVVLERLRDSRGLSPAELARGLDVYEAHVSRWRRGLGISIQNVRKVADFFGVDRGWLERAAGYDSEPGAAQQDIDPDEDEILALFRQVPSDSRPAAKLMLQALAVHPTRPKANRRQVVEANQKRNVARKIERDPDPGDDLSARRGLPPWYARLLGYVQRLFVPLSPAQAIL